MWSWRFATSRLIPLDVQFIRWTNGSFSEATIERGLLFLSLCHYFFLLHPSFLSLSLCGNFQAKRNSREEKRFTLQIERNKIFLFNFVWIPIIFCHVLLLPFLWLQTGISRLNYTPTNDLDYGTISCWGRNAIGEQKSPCIFQIVAAGKLYIQFHNISCFYFTF